MKKLLILFLFFSLTQLPLHADDLRVYSRILDCTLMARDSVQCLGNSICKIEVSVGANDWLSQSPVMKGLAAWDQGPSSSTDWVGHDRMTIEVNIKRLGAEGFEIETLGDFPGRTVLEIKNIPVGTFAEGTLTLRPGKAKSYNCRRYKDPK